MTLTDGAMTTTIMIIAPHPVQTVAVPILRRYAPDALIRGPAHLTVLFPFVPLEELDDASQKVREICADIPPFDITLSSYGHFPAASYMAPADPEPIKAVFRRIVTEFPACVPYDGVHGNDLHPHLTVGEFNSAEEQAAAIFPEYEPLTFRVERLHMLYGLYHVALPYIPHSVIPLKGS